LTMIHIDGSEKSGSGTVVRLAVALSALVGEELHITNIRAKRDKPGLRPQHLASVKACARMCDAEVRGAEVNSAEILFKPGERIEGGHYEWDIGTAGSVTMLLMSVLPMACFADRETSIQVTGGLFQDFAPSAHHMQNVLFPTLEKMGVRARIEIVRPGYVPKGGGIVRVGIEPVDGVLQPLMLLEPGEVRSIRGIALSSHLRNQRVSERMAEECRAVLAAKGFRPRIQSVWDERALQEGASLAIWAETDSGCLLGADQAGKRYDCRGFGERCYGGPVPCRSSHPLCGPCRRPFAVYRAGGHRSRGDESVAHREVWCPDRDRWEYGAHRGDRVPD